MENIVDMIWWILTVAILPLDGSIIMKYICEENFGLSFWFLIVIYAVLSATVGARLYLVEKRKDN